MTPRRLAALAAASLTLTTSAAQDSGAAAVIHPARDAARLVKTIYDPYENGAAGTARLGNCFMRARRPCATESARHVPAALKAKLRRRAHKDDEDPVSCSQNIPNRISYSAPRVHRSLATIVVHTRYASTPRIDYAITVTVDLRGLRLSSLTCGHERR